jgi:hypothetical protein
MRKSLICAASVGAVLAGVVAASALATTITVRAGNLKVTFGATPSPKTLPKNRLAPFSVTISGTVQTTDGTHPSALREAVVEDKNAVVNAKGVPVCRGSQLEARDTTAAKRICGEAIVGRGSAHVEISFPEQKPIKVASPLLIFNGGTKGPKTTMYVHAFITVPVPAAIVTTITVKKLHGGSYAVAKLPVIAGGSGSGLDFQFTFGKRKFTYKHHNHTYLEAKCPDGHFPARLVKAVFKNEAKIEGVAPETVLSGRLAVPCTPKG